MSHNFTPEEREARLRLIAPLWAAGLSMLEIGLEIGISGKNVAVAVKRARKRGDWRFPQRPRALSQMRGLAALERIEAIDDAVDDGTSDSGVRPSPASAWPSHARFDHMDLIGVRD